MSQLLQDVADGNDNSSQIDNVIDNFGSPDDIAIIDNDIYGSQVSVVGSDNGIESEEMIENAIYGSQLTIRSRVASADDDDAGIDEINGIQALNDDVAAAVHDGPQAKETENASEINEVEQTTMAEEEVIVGTQNPTQQEN